MAGIEQGVELVRRACDEREAVPLAQQILRNWQHRLDRLTVLDGSARLQVQADMRHLAEWLGQVHLDPLLFSNRHAGVERRIEPIRRKLVALVGEHGLD